jgi:hypothetical protein
VAVTLHVEDYKQHNPTVVGFHGDAQTVVEKNLGGSLVEYCERRASPLLFEKDSENSERRKKAV